MGDKTRKLGGLLGMSAPQARNFGGLLGAPDTSHLLPGDTTDYARAAQGDPRLLMAAMLGAYGNYSVPGAPDETMRRTDWPMHALARPPDAALLVKILQRLQQQREATRGKQIRSGGLYRTN
jgi:hypothetical protein